MTNTAFCMPDAREEGRRKAGGLSLRRRAYNGGMRLLLWLCAGVTAALVLFLIGYIFWRGLPNLNWTFLTSQESVLKGTEGVLPAVQNTLFVIAATLLFILPLGVGAAIYLTEYASNRTLVSAIEFATETLAGIPSILYALVGMLAFCQLMGLGKTLLAGAFTLVIMTLPTMIRTTQEALKTVPQSYREGALGLGAGKWHMIRTVVLPGSVDGIVTGCILSVGRIVGESAVLMFTAGLGTTLQNFTSWNGLTHSSGATLTVALYVYAKERAQFDLGFSVAAILMLITLAINLTAKAAGTRLKRR